VPLTAYQSIARVRAIDWYALDRFLGAERHPLRERLLWRLLYETAARADEVLALDVADLDRANRRAKVRRKGGAADIIVWRTGTARLLPRYLEGRSCGPLFLTERGARVPLPAAELDPDSGRARLSYRRAAETFGTATAGEPDGPWTLHQLRHSALTHAAEDSADTQHCCLTPGTTVASLARYARVSADALTRWQNDRAPDTRCR
jgi:integrase